MNTRISKAAEFLRKAVRALRGRAGVLRAKLVFLASLRRRTKMVGAASRHLRALMAGGQGDAAARAAAAALAPSTAEEGHGQGQDVAGLSELLREVVDNDDGAGGYPDWTHSLFDEEVEEGSSDGEVDEEEPDNDEPSVIDVIRSRREEEGVAFNVEEEIDHAADMFIQRVRSRMNNRSF